MVGGFGCGYVLAEKQGEEIECSVSDVFMWDSMLGGVMKFSFGHHRCG